MTCSKSNRKYFSQVSWPNKPPDQYFIKNDKTVTVWLVVENFFFFNFSIPVVAPKCWSVACLLIRRLTLLTLSTITLLKKLQVKSKALLPVGQNHHTPFSFYISTALKTGSGFQFGTYIFKNTFSVCVIRIMYSHPAKRNCLWTFLPLVLFVYIYKSQNWTGQRVSMVLLLSGMWIIMFFKLIRLVLSAVIDDDDDDGWRFLSGSWALKADGFFPIHYIKGLRPKAVWGVTHARGTWRSSATWDAWDTRSTCFSSGTILAVVTDTRFPRRSYNNNKTHTVSTGHIECPP